MISRVQAHCAHKNVLALYVSMSHEECTPAVMLAKYTDIQIQTCENPVPKIDNQN